MDVVLTNPRNAVSAIRLGLPVVSSLSTFNRDDNVINWGRSDGPNDVNVLNHGAQIAITINKRRYLELLCSSGVSVPEVYGPGRLPQRGQYVVRPDQHEEGNEFSIANGGDYVADGHHATKFITPTREYRVWFANNKFLTARRIPRPSEGETDESCRSRWGYQATSNFDGAVALCRQALAVAPLHFGAFDLLWATDQHKWYILEVNSAPSLDSERVRNFMVPNIKAMMTQEPAQRPQPATPLRAPARRRVEVLSRDGSWVEIEV